MAEFLTTWRPTPVHYGWVCGSSHGLGTHWSSRFNLKLRNRAPPHGSIGGVTSTGLSMEKVCDNDLQWGNYSHHSFSLTPPLSHPNHQQALPPNISLSTNSSPFLCFCSWLRHHQLSPEQYQSSTDIFPFLPGTIYSLDTATQSNFLKTVITPIIPCLKASSGISYFSLSWPVASGLLTPWNVLLCTHDFSSVKSQQPSHPRKAFLDHFVWSRLPSNFSISHHRVLLSA